MASDRPGQVHRTAKGLALPLLLAGMLLAACSSNSGSSPTTAHNSTTTTRPISTSTIAPHSSSTAPQGTSTTVPSTTSTTIPFAVSEVQHGTGPASLAKFSVPARDKEWDLDWVYSCSSMPTKSGTFKVSIVGYGTASHTTDADVSSQGAGTAGLSRYYDKGTFSLNVTTACQWTVRVETFTS
jgi:hypothetical protein